MASHIDEPRAIHEKEYQKTPNMYQFFVLVLYHKGIYSKKLNAVIVSLDESNLDLYNIIDPQGQMKND